MKRPDHRSLSIALCLALLASLTAFAQSEKVAIKMVPEPNQTVRMKIAQDMDLDMSFEGESPIGAASPTPIKILGKTVFGMTLKVGAPNKDGNIVSELTYDEVSSETTMNGQPMNLGDAQSKLVGQKIQHTFNRQGEMIDFKIPSSLGLSEASFKEMLKSIYGDLPQTTLGVGEVATAPLDFKIPLPVPGAPPLKMDGQIKYTLSSIEKGATGRAAKFNQAVEGKMVSDMEIPKLDGAIRMRVDFKLSGGGAVVMDIDRGVMRSSDSKAIFGGQLKMTGAAGEIKPPIINLQGTIRTTVTGSN